MVKYSLSLLSLSLLTAFPIMAEDYYPEEFADFFTQTTQKVDVTINGLNTGVRLDALVSFDSFTLNPGSQAYVILQDYLQKEYIKPELVERILSQATQGIMTDKGCADSLVTCKLLPSAGDVKYVYDFDRQLLKLFVAPDVFLKKGHKKVYQSPYNPNNALINNSRLNLGYNQNNAQSLTWSNETTLGLPVGYLSVNSQYSASNGQNKSQFDLFRALYNAEYQDIRLQAGRSNYNLSFNTTDYLNNGMRFDGDLIGVGRSQNLLIGEAARQQQYEFYVPQNGTLSVYRSGELILNRVVNEGLQAISYNDLPKGVYSATIEIKVGEQIIQSETVQIVNNNRYVLPIGEWDYVVSAGQFEKKDSVSYRSYADYDRAFGRGAINYRVNPFWFLGAGLVSDREDQYWQLGSSFYFGDKFRLDYSGGVFTSDEYYQIITLNYDPFSLDYRRFDADLSNERYRLSQQLFGESSHEEMSISANGSLWGTQGYIRYSRYLSEDKISALEDLYQYKQNVTTLGLTRPLLTGNLSLSANYTTYKSAKDQFSLSLSWTKALNDNLSIQTNNYYDNNGFNRSMNSANYAIKGDDYSATATAGVEFTREYETRSTLSGTYSRYHKYADLSAYAYTNDRGNRSLTANISSTQVVTADEVMLTSEQGRAFAKINIEKLKPSELDGSLYANLKEDSGYSHRVKVNDKSTLVPLDEYTQVAVSLDQGVNEIELDYQPIEEFVKPGSLVTLDSDANKLVSYVVVFDDIFNQPIEDLTCIGDGCVTVAPLSTDGVYRISYRDNKPVRFLSSKGLCIFDQLNRSDFSFGFCLPSVQKDSPRWVNFDEIQLNNDLLIESALSEPNDDPSALPADQDNLTLEHDDEQQGQSHKESIIYLGQFRGNESSTISRQLDDSHITYKRFDIGTVHYYYIFKTKMLNLAQKVLLQKIHAYALHKNMGTDELLGYQNEPQDTNQQTR